MTDRSFTTGFLADTTPEDAYAAIGDPRGWWTGEIEGSSDRLGDEFTYRHGDEHFSRQRVVELIPNQRISWLVVEGGPAFTEDRDEWPGTTIRFEIARVDERTEVRFTHVGLVPRLECFEACAGAWSHYVTDSLRSFLASGGVRP